MKVRLVPVVVAVSLAFLLHLGDKTVVQGASEPPVYDPDRVWEHARHLVETIGIRPAGSVAEGLAAGYIAGEMAGYGLEVRIQGFPVFDSFSQNVIGTKAGPGAGSSILYVGAHYDSVVFGPGANDNASGVAVLLEAARLLSAEPLSTTVKFIAFGSEESSLTGSHYYAATLTPLQRVMSRAMINMDCVGLGSGQQLAYGSFNSMELAEELAIQAANEETPLPVVYEGRSDHVPFSQRGIPAVLLYTHTPGQTPCGPNYHRPGDRLDTLEPAQLERVTTLLVAYIRYLATREAGGRASQIWLPLVIPR